MAGEKGMTSTFSTFGFIFSVFLICVSLFFERWKQFVMFFLFWFFFTERRYRFLYMIVKTLPRDLRGILRFGLTLAQFYKWKIQGGGTARIFSTNVRRHPNKIAFHFQDQSWTFKQVDEISNQVANVFKSEGVKRGDTVGLLMESRPQVVFYWLGLTKLGAVTALINTNQRTTVLSHSISAGAFHRIICGTELLHALEEVLPEWPQLKVYLTGASLSQLPPGSVTLDTLLSSAPTTLSPHHTAGVDMNDSFLLIYTSGTTGMPKAAKMTHARLFMMARGIYNMMWMHSDDVVYDSLPLYHTAGGCLGVGQAVLNGLTVVIRPKFSVSNFWTDCIKYKCTVAQYIGEMCRFLLAAPDAECQKSHAVRLVMGNGLRPQIWQDFVSRFNIREVGEFYGSTEGNCNMINTENQVGAVGYLPWFATVFNPYYLIKADPETNEPIRTEDGFCIRCDDGEPGILVGGVKKSHPFSQFTGYADKKATEKKILRNVFKRGDEFFNSGDILVRDEFGYFYFKDRTGDTFRWRGENVATSEVEAVISNVVGLKDAIVYGVEVPGVEGRAGMAAVVDPDHSLQLTLLAEGMRKALPAYARPLFLRVMQSTPLTGTFKLKKVDLQNEGYNPSSLKDPVYFFNGTAFEPLTEKLYGQIVSGKMKL
ncbi:long-chain fatty acid transport protein 4-like [Macrosteles quadrilineatus]|uniref:long-chain fatty acid transport protein 4-like n=1 Tax=Macrosteles quadrilineatus TaxID=74068 RepID=UPI0023E1BBBF|nr:long-chain fatty acid transport protein 4-like [Macrosteles quadrilineatus]XP_054290274.1 long-chain fatty acid transport protein 4-like [Macrosteles quadrilineatus]